MKPLSVKHLVTMLKRTSHLIIRDYQTLLKLKLIRPLIIIPKTWMIMTKLVMIKYMVVMVILTLMTTNHLVISSLFILIMDLVLVAVLIVVLQALRVVKVPVYLVDLVSQAVPALNLVAVHKVPALKRVGVLQVTVLRQAATVLHQAVEALNPVPVPQVQIHLLLPICGVLHQIALVKAVNRVVVVQSLQKAQDLLHLKTVVGVVHQVPPVFPLHQVQAQVSQVAVA
jgi:hypothetical protein